MSVASDPAALHLAPRYVRGLQEQAAIARKLSDVAEAMAAEVDAAMKDAAAKIEAAETRAAEAGAFRKRFEFEARQHFKTSESMSADELVRLLARTGAPPAAKEPEL